jgi:hypothetical protein
VLYSEKKALQELLHPHRLRKFLPQTSNMKRMASILVKRLP